MFNEISHVTLAVTKWNDLFHDETNVKLHHDSITSDMSV